MQDEEHPQMQIGILGGTGSGKTTFLGALRIAALLSSGDWNIVGLDRIDSGSTAALNNITKTLLDGDFPGATHNQTPVFYSYLIKGNLSDEFFRKFEQNNDNSRLSNMWKRYTSSPREVSFLLKTYDYPGDILPTLEDPDDLYWGISRIATVLSIYLIQRTLRADSRI